MKTDTTIRVEGMAGLIQILGKLDAERFIALILKEPFDYTKWRENNLDNDILDLRELSKKAMETITI